MQNAICNIRVHQSFKVSNFIPCQLLVSALHKGFFFWDRKDLPLNFSIFLCGEPMPILFTASETITFSMKSENGNGLINSEIAKTMKQVKQIPSVIHEALEQLQNIQSLCELIFEKKAIITKVIKTIYHHIMNNKEHYASRQAHDDALLTKVLQCLNTAIQLCLRSCLHLEDRSNDNDKCLDFKQDFKEIMINKFNIDLFNCLKPAKPAFTKPGDNMRKKSKDELDGTKLFIHNKNQNVAWELKPNEKYGLVCHKNQDKCPKDNNTLICMHFLIKGSCTEGHTHLHKLSRRHSTSLCKTRGGTFRKNKKDQDFQGGVAKK